jgi:putative glutamine amidotransferase
VVEFATGAPVGGRARPRIGLPMATLGDASVRWTLSPAYARAVWLAGGVPVGLPLLVAPDAAAAMLGAIDGLLLCGGGDVDPRAYGESDAGLCDGIDPDRDAVEITLARRALALGQPLLGVCRGCQVLNVATGGTLIQDIPAGHPNPLSHRTPADRPRDTLAHSVHFACSRSWERLVGLGLCPSRGPLGVNSTHHQAIRELGHGLAVAASAADGIIEAVLSTAPGRYALGVQWHPEELVSAGQDGLHRSLFEQLVRAAAQWREA